MEKIVIKIVIVAILASTFSCATDIQYKTMNQYGFGLEISKENDSNLSVFRGNTMTSKEAARRYSMLGAFEDCAEKKQYALVTMTKDLSSTQTSYQSYSTTSMIGQTPVVHTNSYPVAEMTPLFVTMYTCGANFRSIGVPDKIEEASRELVNPVTKDMTGGVLIIDDVNIKDSIFKKSDVILSLGKTRIPDLLTYFKVKDSLPLGLQDAKIIREGKIKTLKFKVIDDTLAVHDIYSNVWSVICQKIQTDGTYQACEKVSLFLSEQQKNLSK
ncbi:MAG: hypothetical protein A2622_08525 [Bdellovibrionales bacterium RIFCSPHIGHO2_01_FULL_40_29]|nr:MAG: hypothetical protein A2622_08525 [Bdellovibrionales bacterium RIFCSPHIGHO2_01_FULL_40_29]OFZ35534.1 MAG: hypothetical protein A3D17_07760 [Bdellovibrionales bacterium RIFCSPHIGHO2_02_FULL_40_15]